MLPWHKSGTSDSILASWQNRCGEPGPAAGFTARRHRPEPRLRPDEAGTGARARGRPDGIMVVLSNGAALACARSAPRGPSRQRGRPGQGACHSPRRLRPLQVWCWPSTRQSRVAGRDVGSPILHHPRTLSRATPDSAKLQRRADSRKLGEVIDGIKWAADAGRHGAG